MKSILALLVFCGSIACAQAQPTSSFPLWPEGAPGALGKEDKDIPTLTAYLPEPTKATGASFVICPGGGYGGLANHEGEHYARFLNEHGIAGFVLKYRLGSGGYRHPVMLQDAARALRTVRGRAVYGLRKGVVEPVFGQIKGARGFCRFSLRGLRKVRGEWCLVCLTHNLLKLWRFGCAPSGN